MPQQDKHSGPERRQHERIRRSFLLSYFDPQHPEQKIEITQLKNISLGGMCFVTTSQFATDTKLGIELKTPYIAGAVYLEGAVLGSHEKMKGSLFETRVEFKTLDTEARVSLEKLMEFFVNGKGSDYE